MSNILESVGIYIENNDEWLKFVQAGILKAHGRKYANYYFLKFEIKKVKEVKNKLSKMEITSALEQGIQSLNFKNTGIGDKPILNLFFTSIGLSYLGVNIDKSCKAFKEGLIKRESLLNGQVNTWQKEYKETIHCVLSIAHDNPSTINRIYKNLYLRKSGILQICIERGVKYVNTKGETIEHFGYVDGISQPKFFKHEIEEAKYFHDEAPLNLALINDFCIKKENHFGSYMVFRKLEQNVKKFKKEEESLADKLSLTGEDKELAGALMVGRFEDGKPVLLRGNNWSSPSLNDFNYSIDRQGNKCPYQAHIRKTNPRGDVSHFQLDRNEMEASRRIVRRGITYGKRKLTFEDQPTRNVGLLFMCFQSSIENQFEFIQRFWANNNDFSNDFTGIDPIIGQGSNRKNSQSKFIEQTWVDTNGIKVKHSLSHFIKMKGGEYFYCPSIPFIKSLNH